MIKPNKRNTKLNTVIVNSFLYDYCMGVTITDIANKYKIHYQTAFKYIHRNSNRIKQIKRKLQEDTDKINKEKLEEIKTIALEKAKIAVEAISVNGIKRLSDSQKAVTSKILVDETKLISGEPTSIMEYQKRIIINANIKTRETKSEPIKNRRDNVNTIIKDIEQKSKQGEPIE